MKRKGLACWLTFETVGTGAALRDQEKGEAISVQERTIREGRRRGGYPYKSRQYMERGGQKQFLPRSGQFHFVRNERN